MRVALYSRVSTKKAEQQESLVNQERAFARWVSESGATVAASYVERASGGSIEGRIEFRRMIAELRRHRVDVIVVDTLDRFTRNLRDGLNLLEELRGHRVGLLPLDWHRSRPIAVDDDSDWRDVVEEFTGAERERRRIRRRVLRSYEGRRERGATTSNRAPFGTRKVGDRLVEDPETAWIVREVDARLVAGEPSPSILVWARAAHPNAWKVRASILAAAANPRYVTAGVRTPETHRQLATLLERHRARYGTSVTRRHDHEFTGVFHCPRCGHLMSGFPVSGRQGVICPTMNRADGGHPIFIVAASKFSAQWGRYLRRLEAIDGEQLRRWAAGDLGPHASRTRALYRRISDLEQRTAALKARRDAAFDLFADPDPAVRNQARRLLAEVDSDEGALEREREIVLAELSASPAPRRDADELEALLGSLASLYDAATIRERNALNRALCAHLGSHPTIERPDGPNASPATRRYVPATITWPEADALLRRKRPSRRAVAKS